MRSNEARNRTRKGVQTTKGAGAGSRRKQSPQSGKDALTGLSINFIGLGTITSDEVIGKDSRLVRYIAPADYLASVNSLDIEIEFNESFVVFTAVQKGIAPAEENNISRTVLEGRFEYRNNSLVSARVDYMAQASDSGASGYGGISYLNITIPEPTSAASWAASINSALERASSSVAEFDIGINTPGVITGNYQAVEAFGGGRFFNAGWKDNPLTSNLID